MRSRARRRTSEAKLRASHRSQAHEVRLLGRRRKGDTSRAKNTVQAACKVCARYFLRRGVSCERGAGGLAQPAKPNPSFAVCRRHGGKKLPLDTAGLKCYTALGKSDEREKYPRAPCAESPAAGVSRDGERGEEHPRAANPKRAAVRCASKGAAGRALQRQRFKGERVRKVTARPAWARGNSGGTAEHTAALRPEGKGGKGCRFFIPFSARRV